MNRFGFLDVAPFSLSCADYRLGFEFRLYRLGNNKDQKEEAGGREWGREGDKFVVAFSSFFPSQNLNPEGDQVDTDYVFPCQNLEMVQTLLDKIPFGLLTHRSME